MRLWLHRTAEIGLREQLRTQLRLAILCGELQAGQRLPSTRTLARRFGIHANTASATYREMEQEGWVEFRHGSGVYVRAMRPNVPQDHQVAADALLSELLARARAMGVPTSLLQERMRLWLEMRPPGHWLLIEPDEALRAIVVKELQDGVTLPVESCAPGECVDAGRLDGAMLLVLPTKAAMVRKLLPAARELTILQVHPVAPALGGYLPLPEGVLVGIASRWTEFQRVARTMLIAAGLSPENLLVRDAAKPGWKRGLTATAAVVCDAVTAAELPKGCHAIEFRLLSSAALAELRVAEAAALDSGAVAKVSCAGS